MEAKDAEMAKALKEKDVELARELKEAQVKSKKTQDQLNKFKEIAELNRLYRDEVESLKKKIDGLNAENQQLRTNFLSLTDLKEKEKAQHGREIERITHTMEETERYLVDHLNQSNEKLVGKY